MRFLHTADWHLGRRLHGFDLTHEHLNVFRQIEQISLKEKVDGIIVAGDLYDRSMPAEKAVQLFNQTIQKLNLTDHIPIYMISGNHDSSIRLSIGTPWYRQSDLYLNTELRQAFCPIELADTQLFLLPYFEPFAVRKYFHDDRIRDLNTAFKVIINKMKATFNPHKKHVLVAHFFANGSSHTDSETKLSVGGLAGVSEKLMADFDYVALGHLHNKDALHSDNIQYSGSPLKFSLSEAQQTKGVFIVDTNHPHARRFVPLKPLHDLQLLKGSFTTMTNAEFYQHLDLNNYYGITLTDVKPIPNVLVRLRKIYPWIVELRRSDSYHPGINYRGESSKQLRHQDPLQLLAQFYQSIANEPLTEMQKRWAKETLKAVNEKEKK